MRAFAEGRATREQQQRAWGWIMFCSGGGTDAFNIGDSQRETDYALGKQHVARAMLKLTHISRHDQQRGTR